MPLNLKSCEYVLFKTDDPSNKKNNKWGIYLTGKQANNLYTDSHSLIHQYFALMISSPFMALCGLKGWCQSPLQVRSQVILHILWVNTYSTRDLINSENPSSIHLSMIFLLPLSHPQDLFSNWNETDHWKTEPTPTLILGDRSYVSIHTQVGELLSPLRLDFWVITGFSKTKPFRPKCLGSVAEKSSCL